MGSNGKTQSPDDSPAIRHDGYRDSVQRRLVRPVVTAVLSSWRELLRPTWERPVRPWGGERISLKLLPLYGSGPSGVSAIAYAGTATPERSSTERRDLVALDGPTRRAMTGMELRETRTLALPQPESLPTPCDARIFRSADSPGDRRRQVGPLPALPRAIPSSQPPKSHPPRLTIRLMGG